MFQVINKNSKPISRRCSLSIPPENIRKPLVFGSFREYRKTPVT